LLDVFLSTDDKPEMGSIASISNNFSRYRWWLLTWLLVLMVAGCAGTAPTSVVPTRADATDGAIGIHSGSKIAASSKTQNDRIGVERKLRSEVRRWEGTPHRMGGATRRGIDCSGFVQRLYQDIFGRRIPRSTATLVKSGRPVGRRQLRAGDLVFFRVPHKGRHVGIYLSHSEFAHASTSKGVTVSSLEDPFWRKAYWTARRYPQCCIKTMAK
jgi:cell wall-associated NlpC family hydrolase